MIWRFALADQRRSWRAWVGVWVTLLVTAAALTGASLVIATGNAQPSGVKGTFSQDFLSTSGVVNAAMITLVGWLMIRATAAQLVHLRTRAMSSWQLVGLSPRQVGRVLLVQGFVAAATALVTAPPLGYLVARVYLAGAAAEALPRYGELVAPPVAVAPSAFVVPTFLLAVATFLGLRRPYRMILQADPVTTVRDLPDDEAARVRPVRILLAAAAVSAAFVWLFWAVDQTGSTREQQAGGALFTLLLAVVALVSASAPVVIVAVHRGWTWLVPRQFTGWHLARAGLVHAPKRVVAACLPLAVVVILPAGLQLVSGSFHASEAASAARSTTDGAPLGQVLLIVGLPCVVAIVGAAMALMSAGARRDADLALISLAGATPRSLMRQIVAEAVSVSVTGLIAGGVGLGVVALATHHALSRMLPVVVLSVPVPTLALTLVTAVAVTGVAVLAPALPALSRPPHRVHAAVRD